MDYLEAKINMIIIGIVIIGALNWLTIVFGYDLVDILNRFINKLFNSNLPINNYIYIIIGFSAIYIASRRTTWLPFLGESVLPSSLIPLKENKVPEDNKNVRRIQIKTKPNSKIAYWASLPNNNSLPYVEEAYDDYSNSGVVMSDKDGKASLIVIAGTDYIVPGNKKIKRHVHYRIINAGMTSKIYTKYY